MPQPPDNPDRARFLAQLSHELRTPLNAVIGFAEAIKSRAFGPLSDGYAEQAGYIYDAGRHMLALINAMSDMADAGGERRRAFETFDVCAAMATVVAMTAAPTLKFAPSPAIMIFADRVAIGQIAINLIANAVKAVGPDGEVTLAIEANGRDLVLTVDDAGPGIAAARPIESDRLGLGLALARGLCRLHGGGLTIYSQAGVGVTAVARLPVIAQA